MRVLLPLVLLSFLGCGAPEAPAWSAAGCEWLQGALQVTDVPTHLSIVGRGYFPVSRSGRVTYSRRGDFLLSATGALLDSEGAALLAVGREGELLPVRLPVSTPLPSPLVRAGVIAHEFTLKLALFEPAVLQATGPMTYEALAGAEPAPSTAEVVAGVLEQDPCAP